MSVEIIKGPFWSNFRPGEEGKRNGGQRPAAPARGL